MAKKKAVVAKNFLPADNTLKIDLVANGWIITPFPPQHIGYAVDFAATHVARSAEELCSIISQWAASRK